ncbi:MAG: hypothetical protein CSA64_04905 [Arachnia propionica]|nr:MAG: hypothetical protein CSA64_04905 [Arachnia propionica]
MTRPTVKISHDWVFPRAQRLELATGLSVHALHMPGQHLAVATLLLPAPLAHEPKAHEGVATLALHAADEATASYPDGGFTAALEMLGAQLSGEVGERYTAFFLDLPVRHLRQAMSLLTEVVGQAQFHPHDLAHHTEQQLAELAFQRQSPSALATQALRSIMYSPADRRSRPTAGSPNTIAALTQDSVIAWQQRLWRASAAILVLVGDFTETDLADSLAPLESWAGLGQPPATSEPPAAIACTVLVDLPNASQATLRIGQPTIGRTAPDWAALRMAGHVLAGGFSSRLNLELRERLGYTYGIGGGMSARSTDGRFSIGANLSVAATADALHRIRQQLALAEPITEAEVSDAATYLIGIGPLANETAAGVAKQASSLLSAGMGLDYVDQHRAELAAVTADAATAALRRHVQPDQLCVAVVGPAAELAPALGEDVLVVTPEALL